MNAVAWFLGLLVVFINLAQVAFSAWIAIVAFRQGEDVWAAAAVALTFLAASRFSDREKK